MLHFKPLKLANIMPIKKPLVTIAIIIIALITLSGLSQQFKTSNSLPLIDSPAVLDQDEAGYETETLKSLDSGNLSRTTTNIVPPNPGSAGLATLEEVTQDDRLIIKNGHLSIISTDVSKTVDQITNHTQSINGFVTQSYIRYPQQAPVANVNIRVPIEQFEATRQFIRQLAQRVVTENITGTDVTEEYVDSEARLRNLEASEQQFLEIMKRAQKVEEILQVQQQLERVRGQIETTTDRLQYLERSAKLATLSIAVSTDEQELPLIDPASRWRPALVIKEASRSLILTAQKIANQLIWLVVFAPVWATALIVAYFVYRILKKKSSSPPRK
jgi:hypothetical protein